MDKGGGLVWLCLLSTLYGSLLLVCAEMSGGVIRFGSALPKVSKTVLAAANVSIPIEPASELQGVELRFGDGSVGRRLWWLSIC